MSDIKRIRNIMAHYDKIIDRSEFGKSESWFDVNTKYRSKLRQLVLIPVFTEIDSNSFIYYFLAIQYLAESVITNSNANETNIIYKAYRQFIAFSKRNKDIISGMGNLNFDNLVKQLN
jgi:hypothetical protein